MKIFFKNLGIFLTPFFLFIIFYKFYFFTSGDLGELGKIKVNKEYRAQFISNFNEPRHYFYIKEIKPKSNPNKTRVLIIGDSFSSGQGNFGYVNDLAKNNHLEVVLFDEALIKLTSSNPVAVLYGLINSDFFDEYQFDFVILENVERHIAERCEGNFNDTKFYPETLVGSKQVLNIAENSNFRDEIDDELNNLTLFYQYNFLIIFNNRAFTSKVYQFNLSGKPFSTGEKLLVYYQDHTIVEGKLTNDQVVNIVNTNEFFETNLMESDVRYISLICPDKYDIYHPLIIDKSPKPHFFKAYNAKKKTYLDLNCYQILSDSLDKGIQDIYFYDDSHFSPIGHEIISKSLAKLIEDSKK